jgi:hypothetical protein
LNRFESMRIAQDCLGRKRLPRLYGDTEHVIAFTAKST